MLLRPGWLDYGNSLFQPEYYRILPEYYRILKKPSKKNFLKDQSSGYSTIKTEIMQLNLSPVNLFEKMAELENQINKSNIDMQVFRICQRRAGPERREPSHEKSYGFPRFTFRKAEQV